MTQREASPMLAPYRVLDLTDEKGYYCGQMLGSLGADVIKIEKPGGDPGRNIGPFFHNICDPEKSLNWFAYNCNKRSITLDIKTDAGKDTFKKLVRTADAVIESFAPGYMDEIGLGYSELKKISPGIIVTTITPFGQSGPYRGYRASDLICWAMGGLLAQTGDPDYRPVRISHINFAHLIASMDAAWGTAIALYYRGTTGKGQKVDVSIQQSMAKTTFLSHESWEVTGKEQTRASSFYKVHRSEVKLRQVWDCKDGYIAFLIFGGHWGATHDNPRMVKWMSEVGMVDDYLGNMDWARLNWRRTPLAEVEKIHAYFDRFFKIKTKAELLEEALKRGIALQPINTPVDILTHPQLKARNYWQELQHEELGTRISYPNRFCLPSESPCKLWRHAPHIGEHNREILDELADMPGKEITVAETNGGDGTGADAAIGALAGVKVLAFETAQAGPMTTSLLASFGAQVIRVESTTRLDWHRQVGPFVGNKTSPDRSACYYHVNPGKMGVTINLKHPNATDVLSRLIKWADVVTDNFAGGVMARLGLGFENLTKINPGVIVLSSDTYGQTGPFGGTPLYGVPLTALSGLPYLTGSPERVPQFPGFAITDFIAPRSNALAIVSALDYRRRTGRGQFIDASQFEATIPLMTPVLLRYEVNGETPERIGNRSEYGAPHGVYRCRGNDRWCAITVFTEDEWQRFCEAVGNLDWTKDPDFATLKNRLQNVDKLDEVVDTWTSMYSPEEIMERLQSVGVAAGVVQGGRDLASDPQLKYDHFYQKLHHNDIGNFSYSGWPVKMSETPYRIRRAPFLGEHNEEVFVNILGMSDNEFVELIADGVLE